MTDQEFKVWIWKNYLAHSLRFMLMVDPVKESVLVKIEKKVTKYIKRWLNLPRCCTLATIFHPDVLNLPFLPQLGEQAKMSMIMAIELSKEKHIQECLSLLSDPGFLSRNEIPQNAQSVLNAAKMLASLPVGQLSFLLRAGADCLPTPMNLCCWNYRVSNSCPLANPPMPPQLIS